MATALVTLKGDGNKPERVKIVSASRCDHIETICPECRAEWLIDHWVQDMDPFEERFHVLCEEYEAWMEAQGLQLGSADEHLFDPSLTDAQRSWIHDFVIRWDEVSAERARVLSGNSA